jgi:hypothetical protein
LRPERQATGPVPWVVTQLGQFLGDGYREIRGLISSNTPHNLKKVFTGSVFALILALLAVTVIASQIHPAVAVLAVGCVLMIVYGRTLLHRLALFAGYFLCGFILFIGAGLIVVVPLEKEYPLVAKVIGAGLFIVLCLLIPALLSMRPRQTIMASAGGGAAQGGDPFLLVQFFGRGNGCVAIAQFPVAVQRKVLLARSGIDIVGLPQSTGILLLGH